MTKPNTTLKETGWFYKCPNCDMEWPPFIEVNLCTLCDQQKLDVHFLMTMTVQIPDDKV